jgi:prepilin-type N-terminal cleavage/methylation domain-containing protein
MPPQGPVPAGLAVLTRHRAALARDDRGLTLIELLITIVIMGVIVAPLGDALILFLRSDAKTTARLSESHDAQISAAYFAQDVQSVGTHDWSTYPYPLKQSIELNVAAASGNYPCGGASTPTATVRFAWDDPTTASGNPSVIRVAYAVQTVGAETQLRRITCTGSSTVSSDVVLVHNLVGTPTVTCSTTCTDAAVPATVTLSLQVQNPADTGAALTIVLNGQRRQT